MQSHDTPIKGSGSIIRTCETCGDQFLTFPYRAHLARFCSTPCRSQKLPPPWRPSTSKVARQCEVCGAAFETYPSFLSRGGGRFCSTRCRSQVIPPPWKTAAPKIVRACAVCGSPIAKAPSGLQRGRGRTCSRQCSGILKQQRAIPLTDRFFTKVNKQGPLPENHPEFGECWEWTGYRNDAGYGMIGIQHRRTRMTNRAAWELATGEVLETQDVICHTCDWPPCVRNDEAGIYVVRGVEFPRRGHLFKATHAANQHDRLAKGR